MTDTITQERTSQLLQQQMPLPPGTTQLPAVQQEPRQVRAAPVKREFPAKVAAAIIKITKEIGRIQKEGHNEFQKYKYTRWEDICEKLSPLLSEHGLIVVQSEQSRSLLEENDKGSVLAIVYHFTLVNEHGEQWPPVEWTSIARLRDQKGITDDKAAAKCHTQAEKQFCIKQFKIRTDDYDEDDNRHSLPKKDAKPLYSAMEKEIDDAQSQIELQSWGKNNSERLHTLPADWQDILRARYKAKLAEFKGADRVEWGVDGETGEVDEGTEEHRAHLVVDGQSETDRVAKWDASLALAAGISLAVLEDTWTNVPAEIKPALQAAFDRRHKPAAQALVRKK